MRFYTTKTLSRPSTLPQTVKRWSLTTRREKLIKIWRFNRPPRPLGRVPVPNAAVTDKAVRQDPAPDRLAQISLRPPPLPVRSIESSERQSQDEKGVSLLDREPLKRDPNARPKDAKRFCATRGSYRFAGLPGVLERRMIDLQDSWESRSFLLVFGEGRQLNENDTVQMVQK
jgi:hypothetical protein